MSDKPVLKWSPEMIENLRDRKGAGVIAIHPNSFISLTADEPATDWIQRHADETKPLEQYNEWATDRKITIGPFLRVNKDGKVVGHEGRHRAAALAKAGGDLMLVGVLVEEEWGNVKRGATPDDIPTIMRRQFRHGYVSLYDDARHLPRQKFSIEELRKAKGMDGATLAGDKYVFVEWRENGQYYGANYRESELAELKEKLRKRGVKDIAVDDEDVNLGAATLGLDIRDYDDPDEFEEAVERELGHLVLDCAASTKIGVKKEFLEESVPGVQTGTYDVCLSTNQIKQLFGSKANAKNAKRLGCGTFACAWTRDATTVVKLTTDQDDVVAFQKGQGLEHVADLEKAFELARGARDEDGDEVPLYGMIVERLEEPDDDMKQALDEMPTTRLARWFEEMGVDEPFPDDMRESFHEACEFTADYTEDGEVFPDCVKFADEVYETVDELRKRGIPWTDIHQKNVGVQTYGVPFTSSWKALDIGFTGLLTRPDVKTIKGAPEAMRKMKGPFCERTVKPKAHFDARSFRWKQSGKSWLLIGCPKGKWDEGAGRCQVGTRAHKVLAKAPKSGRCRRGRKIKK